MWRGKTPVHPFWPCLWKHFATSKYCTCRIPPYDYQTGNRLCAWTCSPCFRVHREACGSKYKLQDCHTGDTHRVCEMWACRQDGEILRQDPMRHRRCAARTILYRMWAWNSSQVPRLLWPEPGAGQLSSECFLFYFRGFGFYLPPAFCHCWSETHGCWIKGHFWC